MRKVAACGLFLYLSTACGAQTLQPDIATDQELLAAYCAATINLSLPGTKEPGLTSARSQLSRFQGYLVARGIFSNPRTRNYLVFQGVNRAAEQASADKTSCDAIQHRCFNKCAFQDRVAIEELGGCSHSCANLKSECQRIDRCWEDHLPIPF